MDDEQLIEAGLAGRLSANSAEFERFVDITARRPSGASGAAHYRDAAEHEESFALGLGALELTSADRLVELCFGGGQVLERALAIVSSAAGIDHSPDMLALARERNAGAVAAGRLELVQGDCHALPWSDGQFTCAVCLNAFFFIDRPTDFLAEVRRVLAPGSRFVVVTARPNTGWNGPWSPALRTYEPEELRSMLLAAGFADATVDERRAQLAVARA